MEKHARTQVQSKLDLLFNLCEHRWRRLLSILYRYEFLLNAVPILFEIFFSLLLLLLLVHLDLYLFILVVSFSSFYLLSQTVFFFCGTYDRWLNTKWVNKAVISAGTVFSPERTLLCEVGTTPSHNLAWRNRGIGGSCVIIVLWTSGKKCWMFLEEWDVSSPSSAITIGSRRHRWCHSRSSDLCQIISYCFYLAF